MSKDGSWMREIKPCDTYPNPVDVSPAPPGYHARPIKKGTMGAWNKVVEEFEEAQDAHDQGNKVMVLIELADLIGAIEAFVETRYNRSVNLNDLIRMKDATKRAFESGERK